MLHLFPHLSTSDAISFAIANSFWVAASFIWMEVTRDSYHILSHLWKPLKPFHAHHHACYSKGFRRNLPEYWKNLKLYELPEAFVKQVAAILFWLGATWVFGTYAWGSIFGVWRGLKEIVILLLRLAKFDRMIQDDTPHDDVCLWSPPTQWWVNSAGHSRHHFENPQAYFSGVFALTDRLLGTALSLKGKRVVAFGDLGSLEAPLQAELERVGACFCSASVPDDQFDLERVDITVLALSGSDANGLNRLDGYRLMHEVFATVRTNADVARKEVWCLLPESEAIAPWAMPLVGSFQAFDDLFALEREHSPCVMREVVLGPLRDTFERSAGTMPAPKVAKSIVRAFQQDRRSLVFSCRPFLALRLALRRWVMGSQWHPCQRDSLVRLLN